MAAKVDHPAGSLATALDHASRLLARARARRAPGAGDPRRRSWRSAGGTHPGFGAGVAGRSRRRRAVLEPLARAQPRSADTHHELGLTLAASGESRRHSRPRPAVALKRDMPDAWRALGDQLGPGRRRRRRDLAYAEIIRASVKTAADGSGTGPVRRPTRRSPSTCFAAISKASPTDVAAMRMRRKPDAPGPLRRCRRCSPAASNWPRAVGPPAQTTPSSSTGSRRRAQALVHVERLLADAPQEPGYQKS